MKPKDLYSPQRQLRIVEKDGRTILITPDGEASPQLAKTLKAEAESFVGTHLWRIMITNLRADAMEIGIEKYTEPAHAMYAKAVFHCTKMMEGIVKELTQLKIE